MATNQGEIVFTHRQDKLLWRSVDRHHASHMDWEQIREHCGLLEYTSSQLRKRWLELTYVDEPGLVSKEQRENQLADAGPDLLEEEEAKLCNAIEYHDKTDWEWVRQDAGLIKFTSEQLCARYFNLHRCAEGSDSDEDDDKKNKYDDIYGPVPGFQVEARYWNNAPKTSCPMSPATKIGTVAATVSAPPEMEGNTTSKNPTINSAKMMVMKKSGIDMNLTMDDWRQVLRYHYKFYFPFLLSTEDDWKWLMDILRINTIRSLDKLKYDFFKFVVPNMHTIEDYQNVKTRLELETYNQFTAISIFHYWINNKGMDSLDDTIKEMMDRGHLAAYQICDEWKRQLIVDILMQESDFFQTDPSEMRYAKMAIIDKLLANL